MGRKALIYSAERKIVRLRLMIITANTRRMRITTRLMNLEDDLLVMATAAVRVLNGRILSYKLAIHQLETRCEEYIESIQGDDSYHIQFCSERLLALL